MPRKPRIEYEGAVYHIMSRGNRQDDIFLDDRDRETFLDTVDEVCGRCGWRIHAFVLMNNHYHLLLETPEANLVAGMKWLQGTYTQRFNTRHKVFGHLLQGRYKALLVDGSGGGEYFQAAGNYVHLNPARARLFNLEHGRLSDYRWSSYPLYLEPAKRPDWLCADRLLGSMDLADNRTGQSGFRRIMEGRVADLAVSSSPSELDGNWKRIRRGWCLGSEAFRDEMLERLNGVIGVSGKRASFDGAATRQHDESEALRLLKAGLNALALDDAALCEMKKGCVEKCCLAWMIRKKTCVTNEWIKLHLHMGKATNFSSLIKRVDTNGESVRPILKKLESIKISD
jgi:putative transposase